MTLFAVELSQLAEVVYVSLLASIGITTTYSLVVFGTGRYMEARRTGRSSAALGYATLAGVFFLLFAAGIVFGVQIMLAK